MPGLNRSFRARQLLPGGRRAAATRAIKARTDIR